MKIVSPKSLQDRLKNIALDFIKKIVNDKFWRLILIK